MKKVILAMIVVAPALVFAQVRGGSISTSRHSEAAVGLGFTQGAANVNAQYDSKLDRDVAIGGYFLMQMDKEKNGVKTVNQAVSFGGQLKAHALQTSRVDAYLAPGFGIHMIKDVNDGGKKTDVTAFGPTMRIGVLVPMTPAMKIGLERMEIWNWFDDKASSSYAFSSAVMAFSF